MSDIRLATCHPDRPRYAKDLCQTCYIGVARVEDPLHDAWIAYLRDHA